MFTVRAAKVALIGAAPAFSMQQLHTHADVRLQTICKHAECDDRGIIQVSNQALTQMFDTAHETRGII